MVAVHAGTPTSALNISDLAHPSQTVLDQLLWGRPSVAMANEWIHNLADSEFPEENWWYIPDQWAYPAKLPASKGAQKWRLFTR